MKRENFPFKVYLGATKKELYGEARSIFLEGFSWDCGWYWGGGYIGNKDMHCHFDGCFLDTPDIRGHPLGNFVTPWTVPNKYMENSPKVIISNGCSVWEGLETFLDNSPEHLRRNWWRIKDLYKQFYIFQKAAEAFQYGGNCTSTGRTEAEINKEMEDKINDHIQAVIIPEIIKALKEPEDEKGN